MNSKDKPKVILFLGSGASAFVGYRTFATFPELLLNQRIRAEEGLGPILPEIESLLKEVKEQLNVRSEPTTHDNFLRILYEYKKLWLDLRTDSILRSRFLSKTMQWSDFANFSETVEDAIREIAITTARHYSKNRVNDDNTNKINEICDSLINSIKQEKINENSKEKKINEINKKSNSFLELAKQDIPQNKENNKINQIRDFYVKLATENNSRKPYLPIFTTNYDTFIEDLFKDSKPKFLVEDGMQECKEKCAQFRERCSEHFWDKDKYDSTHGGLHLMKMHGCVRWFYKSNDQNKKDEENQKVCFYSKNYLEMSKPNLDKLCVMYPGRKQFPGYDPQDFAFNKFYEMLLECEIIIFIGFSFRDEDINHLLMSAYKQRKSKSSHTFEIFALDPNINNVYIRNEFKKTKYNTEFPIEIPSDSDIKYSNFRFGEKNKDLEDFLKNIKYILRSR